MQQITPTSLKFLLLNGPNLNTLGSREPHIYGERDLEGVEEHLTKLSDSKGIELACFQSNHEGALIDRIQQASNTAVSFILFNPGAFTHTSIALRDALLAAQIPFIEIHLSNIFAREHFRHHSYFSDISEGAIIGMGELGYSLALEAAISIHDKKHNNKSTTRLTHWTIYVEYYLFLQTFFDNDF